MSATPINLNKFRKARAKADKKARADRNAVVFGQSRAEARAKQEERRRSEQKLDGHILETPFKGSDGDVKKP